jgi:hypothetical protein
LSHGRMVRSFLPTLWVRTRPNLAHDGSTSPRLSFVPLAPVTWFLSSLQTMIQSNLILY